MTYNKTVAAGAGKSDKEPTMKRCEAEQQRSRDLMRKSETYWRPGSSPGGGREEQETSASLHTDPKPLPAPSLCSLIVCPHGAPPHLGPSGLLSSYTAVLS